MSFFQNCQKPEGFLGKLMVKSMNSGHTPLANYGFSFIKVKDNSLVLDIGCGGGANVKRLLIENPNGKVYGLDYSSVSVNESIKLNKKEIDNKRCEILKGDVMNLPFKENTFDLITAFETIYFWPDLKEAFKQVYKVLKKDGSFLICNEYKELNRNNEKFTKMIKGMCIYSGDEIASLLKEVGFKDISINTSSKDWLAITARK